MLDRPSGSRQPTFIQKHDGDLFVFITDEGGSLPGGLSINTVNGDVLIFGNCSSEVIQSLLRGIASLEVEQRPLSAQQLRCLRAAMQGHSSKQIAKEMKLSPRTVEQHLQRCRERFGATTTLGASALAREAGISLDAPTEPCPLTPRQLQCLRAIARGHRASAVAAELRLSINGLNFHLSAVRRQLGVATTRAAVAVATQAGWFCTEEER